MSKRTHARESAAERPQNDASSVLEADAALSHRHPRLVTERCQNSGVCWGMATIPHRRRTPTAER